MASGWIEPRQPTSSSPPSSRPPATRPSPSASPPRRISPRPGRRSWRYGKNRWKPTEASRACFSRRRNVRKKSAATATTGGRARPERAGSIPRGPAARSRAGRSTLSSTSPGSTPSPTPSGPANACPPRRNGSAPPAAAWSANPSTGATSCGPAASGWPTSGRASSPVRTPRKTATAAPPRSARIHPTPTAWRTCPATSGSGAPTGISPVTRSITTARAATPRGRPSVSIRTETTSPRRVQRGGSFLCSDSYCLRYRAGARGQGEPSTSLSHTGFRCVLSPRGKK